MAWRAWAVAAVAFGGVALGQSPAPGPQVGDVYTQRSAGLPDRQFRVTKVGSQIEVVDVATDIRYAATAALLAGMAKTPAERRQPDTLPSPTTVRALMAAPAARTGPVAARQSVVSIRSPEPARPSTPVYTAAPVPTFAFTVPPSVADAVRADTQAFADDLANALRPSVRETAATGLAEGRHGWRPEVKQLLANAAMTDPAPSVQARCIALLATLGYHEPGYVEFLEATAGTGPDRLKPAARAALAKLR